MASRRISDLLPELQSKYRLFRKRMKAEGLDFIVTATYRSQEEQARLFAKGRTTPGRRVTNTLNSEHTKRRAFDFAMRVNGKISWDETHYRRAGQIGKSVGLVWSGSWRRIRYMTHFELPPEQI